MHDLVIRGGTVVDGTGAPGRTADVAITDGVVTEVGRVDGPSRHEVDADGALVTPGFVDVHTHYDGQATWDDLLTPSCWHGVTTVVMGNCGVGFAPVAPDRHDWLIGLMEGVEDIPGAALSAGIEWGWESFGEFLDALEARHRVIDVGTQVPHGAVRAYVMGERGARNEPASASDIEAMAAIVRDGIRAGALGFSTSRTLAHRAIDGEPVPGTFAAEDELFGIGAVLGELGTGVFELAPAGALGEDLAAPEREMDWMRRLAEAIGRPVTFALTQNNADPDSWRRLLDLSAAAAADGLPVRPQVHGRTVSLLLGFQTFHPLAFTAAWSEAGLGLMPWQEQVARIEGDPALAGPDRGRRRVAEGRSDRHRLHAPEPDLRAGRPAGVRARAGAQRHRHRRRTGDRRVGAAARAVPGRRRPGAAQRAGAQLQRTATSTPPGEMLRHPTSAFGLGDGGAHAGQTCDASTTTFLLTHWARDRDHDRLTVEAAVQKMTQATATLYGLGDRGVLAPGYVGDANVIDHERLQLRRPELVADLPAGASRLIQRADGYVATIKSGEVTFLDGEETGTHPAAPGAGLLRPAPERAAMSPRDPPR
jgi:N-acyl-D-amino-acid deacylase